MNHPWLVSFPNIWHHAFSKHCQELVSFFLYFLVLLVIGVGLSIESGSTPSMCNIKREKLWEGEPDHMLNMFGHGFQLEVEVDVTHKPRPLNADQFSMAREWSPIWVYHRSPGLLAHLRLHFSKHLQ